MSALIYVVDDDAIFIETAHQWQFPGAKMKMFMDPVEALNNIAKDLPDVVITDVMMPSINGVKFASICESILKHKNLVIVSANTKEQLFKDIGVRPEKYYQKPLEDDFFDEVESLIEKVAEEKISADYSPMDFDAVAAKAKLDLFQKYYLFDYTEYQRIFYETRKRVYVQHDYEKITMRLAKCKDEITEYHDDLIAAMGNKPWHIRFRSEIDFTKKLKFEYENPCYFSKRFGLYTPIPKKEREFKTVEVIEKDGISYILTDGKNEYSVLNEKWIDPIHMDNEKNRILSRWVCEKLFTHFAKNKRTD